MKTERETEREIENRSKFFFSLIFFLDLFLVPEVFVVVVVLDPDLGRWEVCV